MQNAYSGLIGSKVTVVTIPREDIEQGNTAPALLSLNRLIETPQALAGSNGTLSLLVSGYDDDPRELHMIEQVRDYFAALDADFPYWFHVCTRVEHSLRLLLMMLIDVTPVQDELGNAQVSLQFANDDLNAFIDQRFDAMESLHRRHGYSEEESERITALVTSYFQALLDE